MDKNSLNCFLKDATKYHWLIWQLIFHENLQLIMWNRRYFGLTTGHAFLRLSSRYPVAIMMVMVTATAATITVGKGIISK